MHVKLIGGNLGVNKTYEGIKLFTTWPGYETGYQTGYETVMKLVTKQE
jgi:hypothetical protein